MRRRKNLFVGDSCISFCEVDTLKMLNKQYLGFEEAKILFELICNHFNLKQIPFKYTGTDYKRDCGNYNWNFDDSPSHIRIHKKGENVAIILHEIAHFVTHVIDDIHGHNKQFADRYSELIKLTENLI